MSGADGLDHIPRALCGALRRRRARVQRLTVCLDRRHWSTGLHGDELAGGAGAYPAQRTRLSDRQHGGQHGDGDRLPAVDLLCAADGVPGVAVRLPGLLLQLLPDLHAGRDGAGWAGAHGGALHPGVECRLCGRFSEFGQPVPAWQPGLVRDDLAGRGGDPRGTASTPGASARHGQRR